MNNTKLSLVLVGLACLLAPGLVPAESSRETRILTGEWNWNAGSSGDLEAVFTPTGETSWNVDFRFEFRGEPKLYSGTADGTLTDGTLSGTVRNEDKRRTFTFSGSFEDGTFRGTHEETTSGRERSTGTLRLAAGQAGP